MNTQQVIAKLRRIPKVVKSTTSEHLKREADLQVKAMRARFSGRPALIARSSKLRDSFEAKFTDGSKTEISVHPGDTRPRTLTGQGFVKLQEFGGDIRPVKAKALTIPTAANRLPNGLPRYRSARALFAQGRARMGRDSDGDGKRDLILVKEGGKWKAMWRLRKFVRVEARLKFFETFKGRDSERKADLFEAVGKAIREN